MLGRNGTGSQDNTEEDEDTEEDLEEYLDGDIDSTEEDDSTLDTNAPYTALLDVITTVIDYSRDFEISNGDNVLDIRESGQAILRKINTSEDMSPSEKADALREAAAKLTEYLNPEPSEKEYKALKYVIRILKARESIIRDTLDVLSEMF